ncbi:MAG: hypothetical protein K2X43_20995 [Hyphomonadaceae bacterium]|jgi:hypothetical protein|nr:hypothetical protein [Hyphomonadaceae bacterium]
MKRVPLWWRTLVARFAPRRSLKILHGDALPARLPRRNLILMRDDGADWSVGLLCPCGCGERLEMMVLKGVRPRWDVTTDKRGRPTLHPSVWLRTGCRSHFWVRRGKILWCE